MLSSQEGALSFVTPAGASHLFFYTSPHLGWKIAIVIPEDQVRSEIARAVWPELAGLFLALVLLSGLTFAGLNLAVIRPLTQLHNVTRDIARTGDLHQQVEIKAQDEIGSLAASFNQMLLSIRLAQEALRQERDLAEALQDAATTLTTTLNFETVLDRILEQVSRVVPNEACNFMLIEGDRVRTVRWLGYKQPGAERYVAQAEFSLSQTPTFRRMASSQEPLLVPDVTAYPDWQPSLDLAWLRSYAATPIIVRDRVIGFLSVDSSLPLFSGAASGAIAHFRQPCRRGYRKRAALRASQARYGRTSSEDYPFFAQISRSLAQFPGARDQLFSHTPLGGIVWAESQPEWRCSHATPKFDRISPG